MKLSSYLCLSRHGVFYFRWPLPRTDHDCRPSIKISLRRQCPERAGTLARYLASCGTEPHRVCWRLIEVGYAAMASVSGAAQTFASASGGGMVPVGSGRRRVLNQSTHARVACSTAVRLRHGPRRWMTSALKRAVDRLGQGLVVAVAIAADGGFDACLSQPFGVFDRQILAASITVVVRR